MRNLTKKAFYVTAGAVLLGANSVTNAINFGGSKVQGDLKGSTEGADSAVQSLIKNAITFLYLIAVVYGLWGGFNILTAGGNDEKVKKGKTIIVQALVGLVVIWLASSVVQWLIGSILGASTTT